MSSLVRESLSHAVLSETAGPSNRRQPKIGPPPLESEDERRTQATRAEPTLAQCVSTCDSQDPKGVTQMYDLYDLIALLIRSWQGWA